MAQVFDVHYIAHVVVLVESEARQELAVDAIAAKVFGVLWQFDLFVEPDDHVTGRPVIDLRMLPRLPHFIYGDRQVVAVELLLEFAVGVVFVLQLFVYELFMNKISKNN